MSIFDRFASGFSSSFKRSAATQQNAISTMLNSWTNQTPSYQKWNFENAVQHGFKKNELIFACISLKADSAAIPRLVARDRRSRAIIENHPTRMLIERPNKYMTEFDFFSATLMYLDLAGVSYWEKVKNRSGKVVELWPMRPDWVSPIRSSGTFIDGYRYAPPGLQAIVMPTDSILEFKLFDPSNMYNGLPPVQVAARMGDVDNASTDFVKLFFEKGGTPPGMLTTKQKLIESQVEEIRSRWRERYGGFENWLDPVVLDSDAQFQKIGLTFEEMGFEFLDARSEARICSCLRTPPILVGASIGLKASTYSNYEAARKAFWQDTLSPQYKRISDKINNDLNEDLNVIMEWDFSKVPALQDDIDKRWARASNAFEKGAITVNQFAEEVGLEKTPDGDVYVRNVRTIEVSMDNQRPEVNPESNSSDSQSGEEESQNDKSNI